MPTTLIKTVNFGSTKTGRAATIGYRLIDDTGTPIQARSQAGVYEAFPGTGIYAANITFPDDFVGTILWDSDGEKPVYAVEEFNNAINGTGVIQQVNEVTSQVSVITGNIADLADEIRFIRGMTAGRWHLNKKDCTMTYYDESGKNMLVTYQLSDENGNPSIESVYDRTIKHAVSMIMSLSAQQAFVADLQMSGSI